MSTIERKYYFMSGLPRSGSTLLSSLLNQNPRFHSGPSSPVVPTILALENSLSQDELYLAYPKPEQARRLIASVLQIYYSDVDRPVIFDKNRSWVDRMNYIEGYFGIQPKILYPVRNIDEILASFISMYRRNPYTGEGKISFMDEMLIKSNQPLNDDSRCQMLAGPMGILGQSYNGLKTVFEQGKQNLIHLIEYDDLINQPKETMEKIYDFLDEKYFEHDYQNIENMHREKDKEVYGLADMHEVRKSLGKVSADPKQILSENILNLCKGVEFWRDVKEFDPAEQEEDENEINFLNSSFDNNEKIIGA
jgi:sulfotransferase